MQKKKVGVTNSSEKRAEFYCQALTEVGVDPVVLIPGTDLSVLEGLDGLLLSGGSDVNPARYGQEPAPETQKPNNERDELEIALVLKAIEKDMPILAICRGMQILNVATGGTLKQHVEGHTSVQGEEPNKHAVAITAGSKLSRIIGDNTTVNSYHHQAVEILGKGLAETAWSDGDITEAVEMPSQKFVLGVQWHPEKDFITNADSRALFKAFAKQL